MASEYLAEHVPHLQSLHLLLGLPPDALRLDEAQIEAAIRNAVSGLVRDREEQVMAWREKIRSAEQDLVGVMRAMGDDRAAHDGQAGEEDSKEALPIQHERLLTRRTELEQGYTERLEKIEALRNQIDTLARLLGPPVEPTTPLKPIQVAGSSRGSTEKSVAGPSSGTGRRSSARHSAGLTSITDRPRASSPRATVAAAGSESTTWLDVSDEVTKRLEAALQAAIEERESRTQLLSDHFRDLLFFHVELALPPIPSAFDDHAFPQHLLSTVNSSSSEVEDRLQILGRYIELNVAAIEREQKQQEDPEEQHEEDWSRGLEGIEPERCLMQWLEEMVSLWTAERDSRIAKIQELYDKLEPLWLRLEVDAETQELFIEMNRGCGEGVIAAYESELERCLELRRSSLSAFVVAARKELEELWDALMYSEDEKNDFGPFIDDDYTEELLLAHEEEVERLKMEMESKASLLPRVKEWHSLKLEEVELEKLASDPNRFSRRGGAMLREEKLRKRVGVLLPKVENDILTLLPRWEDEHDRPFLVNGVSVVDQIYQAREEKEAAKEAKKRAKMGLAPTAPAPSRSVKATPSVSKIKRGAAPGTNMSTTSRMTGRKREAPTPTPAGWGGIGGGGTTIKKQRTGTATSTMKSRTAKPANGTASRTVSGRSQTHATHDPSSSPTPMIRPLRPINDNSTSRMGTGAAGTGRSVSASSGHSSDFGGGNTKSKIPTMGSMTATAVKSVTAAGAKSIGRRESFKPRTSVGAGMGVGVKPFLEKLRDSWNLLEEGVEEEEEEEEEEIEVY